jgi:hypothetical protein
MLRFAVVLILSFISFQSFSQKLTFDDLKLILNSSEVEKIDDFLSKKGFLFFEKQKDSTLKWSTDIKKTHFKVFYYKSDLIGRSVNLFFGDEYTLNEYFELKDEIVKKSKKVSEKIVDGVFNSIYDSRECEVVFHKQISENKQTILYWIELNKYK